MTSRHDPKIRTHPHRDTRWEEHAACGATDPRIFFEPSRYGAALAVCAQCPVTARCRENRGGSDGVWGGRVYGRPPGRPRSVSA